ncbi:MAG: hypothetical protein ACXW6V_15880 [Candidatus Binatia bacterium]
MTVYSEDYRVPDRKNQKPLDWKPTALSVFAAKAGIQTFLSGIPAI